MQKDHQPSRWQPSRWPSLFGDRAKLASRYVVMLALTCCAIFVMLAVSGSWWDDDEQKAPVKANQSKAIFKLTAVTIDDLKPAWHEITETFTGMIRPMERYTVAFEVGGRLEAFGKKSNGDYLDEGDEVQIGSLLAKIDDDLLQAQLEKVNVDLTKANTDLARDEKLRNSKIQRSIITDAEYQESVTAVNLAKAQLKIAKKNLEDATIWFQDGQSKQNSQTRPKSNRRFVVSKRFVQVGESISPHQKVMEIIEVDRVLLTLGIPESQVQQIILQRRQLLRNRQNLQLQNQRQPGPPITTDPAKVGVVVNLLAKDIFGRQKRTLPGKIYRIAETADDMTGLFTVEIEIDNPDGMLRPGLVARATITIGHTYGFEVDSSMMIFKNNQASIFTIDSTAPKQKPPKGQPAKTNQQPSDSQKPDGFAKEIKVTNYIDRGSTIIIPLNNATPDIQALTRVVVQGQHRLVNGLSVRFVAKKEASDKFIPPRRLETTKPANQF